jgi:hypothetical protein
MRDRRWLWGGIFALGLPAVAATSLGGCTGISIAPSCPNELQVGESGEVIANQLNPGAIAVYLWEAIPAVAGRFASPTAPNTTFQALEEGDVTIRLTAGDGLYQVISQCQIHVSGIAGLAVSLVADTSSPMRGDSVTLECTSVGADEAEEFTISQTDGPIVTLLHPQSGLARFVAEQVGRYTFECVGATAGGGLSEPAVVVLSVTLPPTDNANDNSAGNGNENANGNANDNTSGNANTNENDNGTDNGNTNANTNDNGS